MVGFQPASDQLRLGELLNELDNDERIQEMIVLLNETSALRQPILEIKSTVEETKRTVENIFKTIQGLSLLRLLFRVVF